MPARHLPGLWPIPLAIGTIALEIAWYRFVQNRPYPWNEVAATAGVYVLHLATRLAAPLVIGPVAFLVWSHRLRTIPLDTVWGLSLLLLGGELAYYWMHRAGHEVRWMWASHAVHHTPEHIHFASAFRLGATNLLSGTWLFYVPLYWVGFHPLAVNGVLAINLFYQFWLHTDLVGRLGPLEWVLNTPSHHRVHHACNSEYLDRNYGGILIIWDRLFGTFAAERSEVAITYGLVHPIDTLNPIRITFHGWVAMLRDLAGAPTWRERLASLFGRPGSSLSPGDSTT